MKISHNIWLNAWYGKAKWVYWLLPLSGLFYCLSSLRKYLLKYFFQQVIPVPVIVVGNISTGGTGKTPLIIELVNYLQMHGHVPGVVSRGYGGKAPYYPFQLDEASTALQSGDEPLLIYRATKCQVCVAPDRVAAARQLVKKGCSIILSDDGLQHYQMGRNIEIAVIDGERFLGNKQLLPVGPLRESASRLKTVDFVVVNNSQKNLYLKNINFFTMRIVPSAWRQLQSEIIIPLKTLHFEGKLHAVAGIGNPQRFFNTLKSLSLNFTPHTFSDHHKFSHSDFKFLNNETVVMTEKDAVKCHEIAKAQWYSLIVNAQLDADFWHAFQSKLNSLKGFK